MQNIVMLEIIEIIYQYLIYGHNTRSVGYQKKFIL